MSQYFIPANIFLCRDFKTIIHPVHGEIQIEVVAREGWRAHKDSKTLVSGQDVYGMCAWLNANQCDTIERPNKRVQEGE